MAIVIDNEDLRALRTDAVFMEQLFLALAAGDGNGVTAIERARDLADACHTAGNAGGYDFWYAVQGYATKRICEE